MKSSYFFENNLSEKKNDQTIFQRSNDEEIRKKTGKKNECYSVDRRANIPSGITE